MEIAKNETPKDRKAKEQALAENANKWTDSSSANWSQDNPSRKDLGGRWLRKTAWKGHTQKRERSPASEKAVILSNKRSKTTKKNSWVDKDLRKSPKKKCFEENGAV